MNLRRLECFVAVAEEGSFTRAARRLKLSQPSLSQQIRRLERELGGELIERLPRGIRLTAAGNAFLPQAEAAVRGAGRAARLRGARGRPAGRRPALRAQARTARGARGPELDPLPAGSRTDGGRRERMPARRLPAAERGPDDAGRGRGAPGGGGPRADDGAGQRGRAVRRILRG